MKKIIIHGEKLGLITNKETLEVKQLFCDFLIECLSYFHESYGVTHFQDHQMTTSLMEKGWKLWKIQRYSTPDAKMVFLHRKVGGLFSLLKELESEIDLSPIWTQILKLTENI